METITGLFRAHPRTMLVVVLFIFTVLVGGLSNAFSTHQAGMYCPTEDSCAYSYSHHQGTVVRIRP